MNRMPHLCRAPGGKGGDFDFQPDSKKSGAVSSSDQSPQAVAKNATKRKHLAL